MVGFDGRSFVPLFIDGLLVQKRRDKASKRHAWVSVVELPFLLAFSPIS